MASFLSITSAAGRDIVQNRGECCGNSTSVPTHNVPRSGGAEFSPLFDTQRSRRRERRTLHHSNLLLLLPLHHSLTAQSWRKKPVPILDTFGTSRELRPDHRIHSCQALSSRSRRCGSLPLFLSLQFIPVLIFPLLLPFFLLFSFIVCSASQQQQYTGHWPSTFTPLPSLITSSIL